MCGGRFPTGRKNRWWVGNVATSVKSCAARTDGKRRNFGAERQVSLLIAVTELLATLPTHHQKIGRLETGRHIPI